MKTIPYGQQSINKDDVKAVIKALTSDILSQGPVIEQFETKLAKVVGAKYAVVVNSGTAALHTAYYAAGLSRGDEFITTAMTFAATANAGLYLGAKPVFTDVEPLTGNINVSLIPSKITEKTKLIAPVHFGGLPVNLKEISEIAKKHNLIVIDDAAHAFGGEYHGQHIGSTSYSDMTTLSFHPVKHITTGEGGAVVTNNKEYYEKMLMYRTHGLIKDPKKFVHKSPGSWYHEMQILGYNYRLTDFQAALGISQLSRIEEFMKTRRMVVNMYEKAFKNNPYFDIPHEPAGIKHGFHLYSILLKDTYKSKKSQIFTKMRKYGLGVQVHYIPVYLHPYYQKLGYKKGLCPNAEDYYVREISIPMHQNMTKTSTNTVIKIIFDIFKQV